MLMMLKPQDVLVVLKLVALGPQPWSYAWLAVQLGRSPSHINNVFKERELERESNVQNLHIAGSDRPVKFFSLDVIISVGYRVRSQHGTQFRIWATTILKEHLIRGFTLNRQRFERNARELEAALWLVQKAVSGAAQDAKAEAGTQRLQPLDSG